MKRRNFLKTSAALSLLACCPTFLSGATNYNGKFLLTMYANGGWDPTSFCDPKTNVAGQPIINNWAKTKKVQKAGNISYAPFADNENFFPKHYKKMLVINGIDQVTNSHGRGQLYSLTGTLNDGYPSLAAHLASTFKTSEFMPWVDNGFNVSAGGLLSSTTISNPNHLKKFKVLSNANQHRIATNTLIPEEDLGIIRAFRTRLAKARAGNTKILPKQRKQYERFVDASYTDDKFQNFLDNVEKADTKGLNTTDGSYEAKVYSATVAIIAAFEAGITLTAEVRITNFDSHSNHDVKQAEKMSILTKATDLAWNLAKQFNVEDRLIVQLTSDLGRTPRYNRSGGKDHWSTNSTVIMGNNPPWGNRVVGASTFKHYPEKINFNTLKVDSNGSHIEPKHVIASLREYFGMHTNKFDLNVSESIDLFNSSKMT